MNMQKRLDNVLADIERAATKSKRDPSSITLMAVSKTRPYTEILELFDCSQNLFGENRVQEVEQKFPLETPNAMKVHLIGHLQSNKVKKIVSLVDGIDSVDSLRLARRISSQSVAIGKKMPILLQYNTSNEKAKNGFEQEEDLYTALDAMSDLPGIQVKGLMTMGPLEGGEKEIRHSFALLRELQHSCLQRYPHLDFSTLSMGMSSDFPLAIAEGATVVRVGTSLFGRRES